MSEKITDILVENKIIAAENREIYRFGVKQGIMLLLNLFTVVVIGFAYGMILEVLIYIFSYVPLRSYSGGFHAKTHIMCYLGSVIILNAVLLMMKFLLYSTPIYYFLAIISVLLIFFLSPVEDENKRLDDTEIVYYRKKSRLILSLEIIVIIVAYFIKHFEIMHSVSIAITTIGLLLLIGKVKNTIISI